MRKQQLKFFNSWYCEKLISIVSISVVLHFSFQQLSPENIEHSSSEKSTITEKVLNKFEVVFRRTFNSGVLHISKLVRGTHRVTIDQIILHNRICIDNSTRIPCPAIQRPPFPLRI